MPEDIATFEGEASGRPVGDAYGTKTATADTAFTRLVPPGGGSKRARVTGFVYTAAATAHTLTFLTSLADSVDVSSDALSGQAVVVLDSIPTGPDGGIMAANDFVVLRYEDGAWDSHKVSSISGLSVTLTANLAKKVPKGKKMFFLGAPADHPSRQYTINASQTLTIYGDLKTPVCTGAENNTPILAHSNNITNAGSLQWMSYAYGPP